jgi:hypothetical protein
MKNFTLANAVKTCQFTPTITPPPALQETVVGGQWSVVSEQWSVVSELRTTNSEG